jgi:hypothetical protein
VSKAVEYRAKAVEHAKLALISQSEEVCEAHVRIAASFFALANKEAMRDLKASGHPLRPQQFNVPEIAPQSMRL